MKRDITLVVLVISLLGSLLLSLWQPKQIRASGIPDPRFGVVEAYQAPGAAGALGAGWTRVTFRWNEIQPNGPDEWNVAPISDQVLNRELAQGRQVVGLLVTTPGWATDLEIGPGVPRGLHRATDDPANTWATFVRTIVSRYAGRIDHWIIWNEPDIPDTRHMSWSGSTQDFVRLLQVAYTVAKETNPNATIHMAAVTHWWNEDWFSQFLEALIATPGAAAHNYYFDAATLHIYFQPETVYDITVHYRDMMRGHGIHKPIWIAETNAAPSQDPGWPVPNAQFNVSLEQQAAYIVQAFSLGIAAGAERMAVYKMADTATDRQANPEPFGLIRSDGSRRPAFTAYQVAASYLSGFRSARWERRDEVALVTVDRGDRTTSVVWARTDVPQTAMVPARTTRALMVDVRGAARTIYPERGYYYVDLPGADCTGGCQIGGAPYLLVEDAAAGARTAPTPRPPTAAPTEEPKPTASPDHEPTPVPEEPSSVTPSSTPTTTPWPLPSNTPTPSPTPSTTATPVPTATRTPTGTPTSTATPTATPTPTATSTQTATRPPTLSPSASPTAAPSATSTPVSRAPLAQRRSWILIGLLMLGIGGASAAIGGRKT